jgi:hypothetical protein
MAEYQNGMSAEHFALPGILWPNHETLAAMTLADKLALVAGHVEFRGSRVTDLNMTVPLLVGPLATEMAMDALGRSLEDPFTATAEIDVAERTITLLDGEQPLMPKEAALRASMTGRVNGRKPVRASRAPTLLVPDGNSFSSSVTRSTVDKLGLDGAVNIASEYGCLSVGTDRIPRLSFRDVEEKLPPDYLKPWYISFSSKSQHGGGRIAILSPAIVPHLVDANQRTSRLRSTIIDTATGRQRTESRQAQSTSWLLAYDWHQRQIRPAQPDNPARRRPDQTALTSFGDEFATAGPAFAKFRDAVAVKAGIRPHRVSSARDALRTEVRHHSTPPRQPGPKALPPWSRLRLRLNQLQVGRRMSVAPDTYTSAVPGIEVYGSISKRTRRRIIRSQAKRHTSRARTSAEVTAKAE